MLGSASLIPHALCIWYIRGSTIFFKFFAHFAIRNGPSALGKLNSTFHTQRALLLYSLGEAQKQQGDEMAPTCTIIGEVDIPTTWWGFLSYYIQSIVSAKLSENIAVFNIFLWISFPISGFGTKFRRRKLYSLIIKLVRGDHRANLKLEKWNRLELWRLVGLYLVYTSGCMLYMAVDVSCVFFSWAFLCWL